MVTIDAMSNEKTDWDQAANSEVVLESSYTARDVALYALGVGAGRDPLDTSDLRFVYDLGDFQALPTFAVIPQCNAVIASVRGGRFQLPGMTVPIDRVLHAEQYTELRGPLPTVGKLRHVVRFKHAYDKAPNALIVHGITSFDESGAEIAYNEQTAFVKDGGGWGGERGPPAQGSAPPDRVPDAVVEEITFSNQALIYRLSGDWNPLHADPAVARRAGFDRPILHGLCTYGFLGRHVLKAMLGNDLRRFKSIRARFADAVFPGETLITRMWRDGDNRVVAEVIVKERNKTVIKNAAISFRE
jgi:acyl dehydratase